MGATIGRTSNDIVKKRIQKGNQAYERNRHLLKSKKLRRWIIMNVFRTLIIIVITYAMETTLTNKKNEKDLERIEGKVKRRRDRSTKPNI